MTIPIKPPASDHPLQQVEELSSSVGAEKPSGAVQEVAGARQEPVQKTEPGGAAADPLQAIASALRSGEIDAGRAVEMLVERALARVSGTELSGEERQQIESFLRAALQNDPELAAMIKDLERQTG
jgi:hypothetical protein